MPLPPANVEAIEPTEATSPKATFRKKLKAHVSDSRCASCHRKIDPLGFAFENYDAIGRWREFETTATGKGADPVIDSSGTLEDGRHFNGSTEFRNLLLGDIDKINRALVEKLMTYSTRRVMTSLDRKALDEVADRTAAKGFRFKDLIIEIVTSDLFRQ